MTSLLVALALNAPAQQPLPQLPPPLPQPVLPVPQPVLPRPTQPAPVTLATFSRTFTPLPGKHDVWFIHPRTRQPVLVCFTLPGGKMERFEIGDDWIEFEFDKIDVEIEFRKNGRVEVDYDD